MTEAALIKPSITCFSSFGPRSANNHQQQLAKLSYREQCSKAKGTRGHVPGASCAGRPTDKVSAQERRQPRTASGNHAACGAEPSPGHRAAPRTTNAPLPGPMGSGEGLQRRG